MSERSLGRFIRQRRHQLGLSQEQLAERVGMTTRQSDISRLEHDRVALPHRHRMESIADALEVSLSDLLMRSGWSEQISFETGARLEMDTDIHQIRLEIAQAHEQLEHSLSTIRQLEVRLATLSTQARRPRRSTHSRVHRNPRQSRKATTSLPRPPQRQNHVGA